MNENTTQMECDFIDFMTEFANEKRRSLVDHYSVIYAAKKSIRAAYNKGFEDAKTGGQK